MSENDFSVNEFIVREIGYPGVIKQEVVAELVRCNDCMHNGSYDTDCPINWNGKEYCSFAERYEE